MLSSFKILFAILVTMAVAVTTYGYASSNTLTEPRGGFGSGAISGYTVSNVVYNLNEANPGLVSSVNFTLDAEANNVRIKLISSESIWYPCSAVSGTDWTCDTSNPAQTVLAADELMVIASRSD